MMRMPGDTETVERRIRRTIHEFVNKIVSLVSNINNQPTIPQIPPRRSLAIASTAGSNR